MRADLCCCRCSTVGVRCRFCRSSLPKFDGDETRPSSVVSVISRVYIDEVDQCGRADMMLRGQKQKLHGTTVQYFAVWPAQKVGGTAMYYSMHRHRFRRHFREALQITVLYCTVLLFE